MCKRYGQRPSNVLGIDDECVALDFDLTAMYMAEGIYDRSRNNEDGGVPVSGESPEDEIARLESQFNQMSIMQHNANEA